MRLSNPTASLNTIPRRLIAALFFLFVAGVVAALTITAADAKYSALATNTGNTYAASSCFLPVAVSATSSNAFSPSAVTIKAGCSVKWTQTSSTGHTTTNTTPSLGSLWDSANPIGQNNSYTYQFNATGSFPYKCRIHGGMTGTITVN
jgi:plastocyanin